MVFNINCENSTMNVNSKGFETLKHVARGLISDSCVWKRIPLGEPILCATHILQQRLVTAKRWWKLRTNIMVTNKKKIVVKN